MTKADKFIFRAEDHKYFHGGIEVPGVTRLLQDYDLINFDGVPKERLDYKFALGTAVHYAIKLYNEQNLDEDSMHKAVKPYFQAYKKFCEIHKYEPRHTEHRLYSKKWQFAGTMDSQGLFFWKKNDLESIIDWKCSWGMYPANGPQTAGYQILFEEEYKIKIKARFGLQLKPTGAFEIIEYSDPADKTVFLSALTLHHWKVRNGLIKPETIKGSIQ